MASKMRIHAFPDSRGQLDGPDQIIGIAYFGYHDAKTREWLEPSIRKGLFDGFPGEHTRGIRSREQIGQQAQYLAGLDAHTMLGLILDGTEVIPSVVLRWGSDNERPDDENHIISLTAEDTSDNPESLKKVAIAGLYRTLTIMYESQHRAVGARLPRYLLVEAIAALQEAKLQKYMSPPSQPQPPQFEAINADLSRTYSIKGEIEPILNQFIEDYPWLTNQVPAEVEIPV